MFNLTVADGISFCIMCDYDPGVPPAENVHWFRDGQGIDVRDICISLQFNDTQLCFSQISRPYSGTYTCSVSNIAGSDSGHINITVAGINILIIKINVCVQFYSSSNY